VRPRFQTPLSTFEPRSGALTTTSTSLGPIAFDIRTPEDQPTPRERHSPVRNIGDVWRSSTSPVRATEEGQLPLFPSDQKPEMQEGRHNDPRSSRHPSPDPEPRRSRSCDRMFGSFDFARMNDNQPETPRVNLLFSDASYAPPSFSGSKTQDADRWLRRFEYYVQFRQLSDKAALQLFKLLLTEAAADWLESVPDRQKLTTKLLTHAFKERFASSDIFRWQQASAIFARNDTRVCPHAQRVPGIRQPLYYNYSSVHSGPFYK